MRLGIIKASFASALGFHYICIAVLNCIAMKRITIKDLASLPEAAREFLNSASGYKIIAFYARMGGGKTTFITALCNELEVEDTVCSPTFTIVNEYATASGKSIYHFDFYRITKLSEALDIGIEEYFDSDGICLIEWPENIEELLPEDTLKVEIKVNGDGSRELLLDI